MRVRGLESPTELDFVAEACVVAREFVLCPAYSVAPADTTTARSSGRRQTKSSERTAAHAPKNRTRHRSPVGALGAQTRRPRRVACAIGEGRGGDKAKTPQLPRVKRRFRGGRSPPRAFLLHGAGGRGHAQTQAARLGKISKAAAAFFPALFYRSRVPFRAAFFSGPGSTSVSLRHSACKAHITSKHSPASKRLRKE